MLSTVLTCKYCFLLANVQQGVMTSECALQPAETSSAGCLDDPMQQVLSSRANLVLHIELNGSLSLQAYLYMRACASLPIELGQLFQCTRVLVDHVWNCLICTVA